MNKGFWMTKCPGDLGDGGMADENSSRIEMKRPPQWFMDSTEAELFPNKKQAVEVSKHNTFSGLLNSNVCPWGNASIFQSVAGQFHERLFDPEDVRTINFDDRNVPSAGIDNISMGRKFIEDPFGCDSPFGLSISNSLEDHRSGLNYGGIRKVKVNQVKDSENFMSVSVGPAYTRGDNDTYSKTDDNSITMGLSFNRGNGSMLSVGNTFNRENNNFISMGQPYNKVEEIDISMGNPYKENTGAISIGQSLCDSNITTMGQTFSKGDGNMTISMCHPLDENKNVVSMGQPFSKDDSSITSMGQTFNKAGDNTISIGHSYNTANDNSISMSHSFNKVNNNSLSIGHSFTKGESNIISFGGLNDDDDGDDINPSSRLICSYDLLMGQSSVQSSEALGDKGLTESNADAQFKVSGETVLKKEDPKATKKAPANNFPSNVRSLLSTGMLDGVSVKYTAWSREKELRGVIKGSGYLCGCQSCNFSKALNAYEFERHAGCKTKHPNNHIFFENGKTVYGIVQELRNTPQNRLFEVIQTITGSQINQKSFRLWKESFLAATRELQRIYGKEEGKQLS